MAGVFLPVPRVLANRYPLALDMSAISATSSSLGRLLDVNAVVFLASLLSS
jgi:hypothetical protein